MKKYLSLLAVMFLSGCMLETRPDAFTIRSQQLNYQQSLIESKSQKVSERQALLMGKLNDEQLAVFESAVQAWKSDEPVTQEIADRNLLKVLNADEYTMAIDILRDRAQLRHENRELEIDWMTLREDFANFQRQEERRQNAVRDYMMINAIQQNTHRR